MAATTAMVALIGVASAQTYRPASSEAPNATPPAPSAAPAAGGSVTSAMTAYASYQGDVTELRAKRINTADDLEQALDSVARHNRDEMTRGWVAYGAMTAAQAPTFMQGVRDAANYYGRDAVIWAITVDPRYARGLRGGDEAARLVMNSATADSERIIAVADRYQEMAYGLQRQRWANAVAPGQPARLQRVRSLGAAGGYVPTLASNVSPRLAVSPVSLTPGTDPTQFGGRRFWDAVGGAPDVVQVAAQTTYQWRVNVTRGEAIDRMASIAALHALDAATDHQGAVTTLMNDPRSRDCFEMAQLQLYQCMSAARFRYENAFCLGQHGLRDVGRCIGAIAQPDTTAMAPLSTPTATPASTTSRQ